MARERVHYLTVRVTFDKPVSRSEAVSEFRDCVHGEFYPGAYSDAGEFRISGVSSSPKRKGKADV